MWNKETMKRFEDKLKASQIGGGEQRIAKQHESGKLTARERLELLFDKDTFNEVGGLVEARMTDFGLDKKKILGDGVVTGYGKINGRTVFAASQDFTVIGATRHRPSLSSMNPSPNTRDFTPFHIVGLGLKSNVTIPRLTHFPRTQIHLSTATPT